MPSPTSELDYEEDGVVGDEGGDDNGASDTRLAVLNSSFETDRTEIDGELTGDHPRVQ